jgi:drug/metabolite transporter (DMT)-like permease
MPKAGPLTFLSQQAVPRAGLWMMGALASFTMMALAGRELSAELSLFEILFLRSIFCFLILLLILWRTGSWPVRTRRPGLHIFRNSIHYGASYCWYVGIVSIPLTEVFSIEFTAPIWTAVLASIFLSEPVTKARVAAITLGFLGIMVILRPGLAVVDPAALAVLVAAIGYAATYVITKHLTGDDSPLVILFYMNVVQMVIGLVPTILTWTVPSPHLWPWVLVVGISGLTSHYCIARAMRLADATVVAPLDFLRLPLIAVVGYLLYDEPLSLYVLAGALLVVAGNMINVLAERYKQPLA